MSKHGAVRTGSVICQQWREGAEYGIHGAYRAFLRSEWTHNGYPATTTAVSLLPSLNVTCGEREGGRDRGAGGLITHYYYCDILWWSAAATCHPFLLSQRKNHDMSPPGGHPCSQQKRILLVPIFMWVQYSRGGRFYFNLGRRQRARACETQFLRSMHIIIIRKMISDSMAEDRLD